MIATDDLPCMQALTAALCPSGVSSQRLLHLIATDDLPCMQVLTTALGVSSQRLLHLREAFPCRSIANDTGSVHVELDPLAEVQVRARADRGAPLQGSRMQVLTTAPSPHRCARRSRGVT